MYTGYVTPRNSPEPSVWKLGSSTVMRNPPERTRAKPRIMKLDARVPTNELIRPTVVRSPLPTPSARPTASAARNPSVGELVFASLAAMIPATAKIAPTERSKPPAMMTSVAAQAMIPTGAH